MDWTVILAWLFGLLPWLKGALAWVGIAVVVGTVYVKVTPNLDDDHWLSGLEAHPIWGKVIGTLIKLSYVRRVDDDVPPVVEAPK